MQTNEIFDWVFAKPWFSYVFKREAILRRKNQQVKKNWKKIPTFYEQQHQVYAETARGTFIIREFGKNFLIFPRRFRAQIKLKLPRCFSIFRAFSFKLLGVVFKKDIKGS